MKSDKNLFFLIISFVCFWLVLDQYYGKKLIGNFVGGISGGMGSLSNAVTNQVSNSLTDKAEDVVNQATGGKFDEALQGTEKYTEKYKKYLSNVQMDYLNPILGSVDTISYEALKQAKKDVDSYKRWTNAQKNATQAVIQAIIMDKYPDKISAGKF